MFDKYRGKQKISADISMTPMIDVVFQLLTFFMVTSTFIQTSTLNVNLPEAKTSDNINKEEQVITLHKDGQILWNNLQIAKNEIPKIFTDLVKSNPDPTLTIEGDQDISYKLLIETMDEARSVGIQKISLSTVLKR